MRRATTALRLLIATVIAAAALLSVAKDSLVAQVVRVGIAEYTAHVNSKPIVQGVAPDLLTFTAAARGVSVAERGQSPLEAPLYVKQGDAQAQLRPLIRRQVVLDKAAVSGVNVRLEIDRRNRLNLEELFRVVNDDPGKPSPCNVILYQFTVDQATVILAFHDQPVRASLARMAFQGSLTVQPLHVHAAEGAHVEVGPSSREPERRCQPLSAAPRWRISSPLSIASTTAFPCSGCGMSKERLASR